MTILKKDGTVYRLKGPNPLMLEQQRWDPSQIILHNFSWDPVLTRNSEIKSSPPPPKKVEAPLVLTSPVVEIAEPSKVETPQIPVSIPTPKEIPKPKEEPKGLIRVHCLPGTLRSHRDELYGENHVSIIYGEKFEFNANVVDKSDMVLILWTAKKGITEGSIVYPQTGHARWWRVDGVETAGMGHKVVCIPSDEQPSF